MEQTVQHFNIAERILSIYWKPEFLKGAEPFSLIPKATEIVYHGGRLTGKTTLNAIKCVWLNTVFKNVDTAIIGWSYEALEQSVYPKLMEACKILNVPEDRYYCRKTAKEIHFYFYHYDTKGELQTNHIHFFHGREKAEAFRSVEPEFPNRWIMIWYFELGTFQGWSFDEIMLNNATFTRSMLYVNKAGDRVAKNHPEATLLGRYYYEYNTPKPASKYVWVNEFTRLQKMRACVDYHFNDYEEFNPDEALLVFGKEELDKAEWMKKFAHASWENIYKGLEGWSGDQVFYPLKETLHLGRHDFNKIRWMDCTIGVDVGRHAATVITATLIGKDTTTNKPVVQMGYKYWYHCNMKGEWKEWNWTTDSEGQAIKNFRRFDVVTDYTDWIKKFLLELRDELRPLGINYITMNLDYAGEGSAWWDRLFEKWAHPSWLEAPRKYEKLNNEVAIDAYIVLFAAPGCVKFHSPQCFNGIRSIRYDKYHDIEDNPKDFTIDVDTYDSMKYSISKYTLNTVLQEITHTDQINLKEWVQ